MSELKRPRKEIHSSSLPRVNQNSLTQLRETMLLPKAILWVITIFVIEFCIPIYDNLQYIRKFIKIESKKCTSGRG